MKWVLNILGVILALAGSVWILQGVNVLPGSFMSGNMMWAYIGIVLDAAAAVLFYFANRRRAGQDN
jgi:hypothetical protein